MYHKLQLSSTYVSTAPPGPLRSFLREACASAIARRPIRALRRCVILVSRSFPFDILHCCANWWSNQFGAAMQRLSPSRCEIPARERNSLAGSLYLPRGRARSPFLACQRSARSRENFHAARLRPSRRESNMMIYPQPAAPFCPTPPIRPADLHGASEIFNEVAFFASRPAGRGKRNLNDLVYDNPNSKLANERRQRRSE